MSSGWDFIDFMHDFYLPIHTIATGTVASMALNILIAGTKKYTTANTHFLAHQFSASVGGKRQEILDYMKHFEHIQEQVLSFISTNTKLEKKPGRCPAFCINLPKSGKPFGVDYHGSPK